MEKTVPVTRWDIVDSHLNWLRSELIIRFAIAATSILKASQLLKASQRREICEQSAELEFESWAEGLSRVIRKRSRDLHFGSLPTRDQIRVQMGHNVSGCRSKEGPVAGDDHNAC